MKSLSDQQLSDLRAGRGMGMALPAELNGYPGPVHVLELADALGLTPEQREKRLDEEERRRRMTGRGASRRLPEDPPPATRP